MWRRSLCCRFEGDKEVSREMDERLRVQGLLMLSSGKSVSGIKREEWVAISGEYGEVREESN